jgi:hypothetical protein
VLKYALQTSTWPSENSGTRGEEESGLEKNKATKAAKEVDVFLYFSRGFFIITKLT